MMDKDFVSTLNTKLQAASAKWWTLSAKKTEFGVTKEGKSFVKTSPEGVMAGRTATLLDDLSEQLKELVERRETDGTEV
jgi:hypothetical protein